MAKNRVIRKVPSYVDRMHEAARHDQQHSQALTNQLVTNNSITPPVQPVTSKAGKKPKRKK